MPLQAILMNRGERLKSFNSKRNIIIIINNNKVNAMIEIDIVKIRLFVYYIFLDNS